MRDVTVRYYTKEDCEALHHMTKTGVACILNAIEGTYISERPEEYYQLMDGDASELPLDFKRLRVLIAIQLAAKWLKEQVAEEHGVDFVL